MNTIAAGPEINAAPGSIVTGEFAKQQIDAGFATPIVDSESAPAPAESPSPVETAAVAPPETTTAPAAKKRKGR